MTRENVKIHFSTRYQEVRARTLVDEVNDDDWNGFWSEEIREIEIFRRSNGVGQPIECHCCISADQLLSK